MAKDELDSISERSKEKKEDGSNDDSLESLGDTTSEDVDVPPNSGNVEKENNKEGTKSPAAEIDAESEAINKFKGELKKIKGGDSSGDDDTKTKKKRTSYNKGDRPAKRPKQRVSHYVRDTAPPSTFVMKLFDRSIDLTQFTQDSPLYPICRSWFMNNPKTLPGKRESKKREERRDRDHYTLPEPLLAVGELAPAPPLTAHPLAPDFELEYDPDIPLPSREELLAEHYENWAKAKKFHIDESAKRERCYKPSLSILRDLYCSRLV